MVYRILVVDDDPNIRKLLEINLIAAGYQVEQAVDGRDALDRIAGFRPHVIILDIMMPGIDGWEVCKTVKDMDEDGNIRILMLTARDTPRDRLIGQQILKADEYITKPFDIIHLLSTVAALLEQSA